MQESPAGAVDRQRMHDRIVLRIPLQNGRMTGQFLSLRLIKIRLHGIGSLKSTWVQQAMEKCRTATFFRVGTPPRSISR